MKYSKGYIKQDSHDSLIKTNADAITTLSTTVNACTQTDVTASRALGTTYRNTGTTKMLVTVTLAQAGNTGQASSIAYSQATTPANTTKVGAATAPAGVTIYGSITFAVPPSYYYCLSDADTGGGSTGIYIWIEWT